MPRLVVLLLPLIVATSGHAATFSVTNVNDTGAGSLRAAITSANGTAGPDEIHFAIAGGGVHVITVATVLPSITEAVTIDGTTQPGYAGAPLIELDGSSAGAGASGLALVSHTGSTIRGLAIGRFVTVGSVGGVGIVLNGGGGHRVEGTYLGLAPDGVTDHGNGGYGLSCLSSSGNVVGGAAAAAANVISGNTYPGIRLWGCSNDVVVGNRIGTTADGLQPVANATGILIMNASSNERIGGTDPGAGNLISGNTEQITVIDATGTVIQGTLIGTDATGMPAAWGGDFGIDLAAPAVVGGTTSAARNVIGGQVGGAFGAGILLSGGAEGSTIQGNFIGVAADGTTAAPNGTGILFRSQIQPAATDVVIGGVATGAGNRIASNQSAGIGLFSAVTLPQRIRISGNSIVGNGGLGIDFEGDGITPNDDGDGDDGPNGLQNFPILTGAVVTGDSVHVTGSLHSTPMTAFTVEAFASATADPSGNGEGEMFLGTTMVSTDASGDAIIDAILAGTVPPGGVVTATATDATGSTSEFSPAVTVVVSATTTTVASASSTTTSLPGCASDLDGLACLLAAVPPPDCSGQSVPASLRRAARKARTLTDKARHAKVAKRVPRLLGKVAKLCDRAESASGSARAAKQLDATCREAFAALLARAGDLARTLATP
jgi:hypothetical protein